MTGLDDRIEMQPHFGLLKGIHSQHAVDPGDTGRRVREHARVCFGHSGRHTGRPRRLALPVTPFLSQCNLVERVL